MASKIILCRKGEFINRRQRFKVLNNSKEAGFIKNHDTENMSLSRDYIVQCSLTGCTPVHTV